MLVPALGRAGRGRDQLAGGVEADVRAEAEVVVVVIRDTLADDQLEHDVVLEATQPPNVGKRSAITLAHDSSGQASSSPE